MKVYTYEPSKPRQVTTHHLEIGYTNNVEIIEKALREVFGIDDNSHVITALAAHIWSAVCGGCDDKTWGDREIKQALERIEQRIRTMRKTLWPIRL